MIIDSPLSVPVSKNKKFILNLNNYRNAHYQTLNKSKQAYKAIIGWQIKKLNPIKKAVIHYTLYPATNRLTDIGNVVSIHKKYFEDALTYYEVIPDDNYNHVISSSEFFGGIDKENPRVEIKIKEIK